MSATAASFPAQVAQIPQGVPRARWTTPRVLRLLLALVVAAAVLVGLVGARAVTRAREAVQVVGRDTAPAIIAAQEVGAAFADLDTNLGRYLLVSDRLGRDQAVQLFEYRRAEATKRLVDAAKSPVLGEGARAAIILMFENLGRYAEAASRARAAADRGDAAGALDAYRVATDILHARILVDAQRLDDDNRALMDQKYQEQQRASRAIEALALVCGLALVAVLAWTQVFLLSRTRRIVNLPLLLATVVALVYTGDVHRRIGDAREDLRVAKEDAFDSIHALWKAREKASDANGDETRWLVDPARRAVWQTSFAVAVKELTDTPDSDAAPGSGLFDSELRNVTFVGEQEAAFAMVHGYARYYGLAREMRNLETSGGHDAAVTMRLGPLDAAFTAFDSSGLRTLDINQNVFDTVVLEAEGALANASWLGPLLALAVAFAAWLGVRPRLREYAS